MNDLVDEFERFLVIKLANYDQAKKNIVDMIENDTIQGFDHEKMDRDLISTHGALDAVNNIYSKFLEIFRTDEL